MKNEKGYVLVTILLIIIIFSILGLSILGVTINSSKRTVIEGENLQTSQDALREMEIAIAKIKVAVKNREKFPLDIGKMSTYNNSLKDLLSELSVGSMRINNITTEEGEFSSVHPNTHFNRALEITYEAQGKNGRKRTISRKVYLSSYPSFLNYVAGSRRGLLNLNGAVQIEGADKDGHKTMGNVYANDLFIQNLANYKDGFGDNTKLTNFPSIFGRIFLINSLNMQNKATSQTETVLAKNIHEKNTNVYPDFFYDSSPGTEPSYIPFVYPEKEDFIDINFLSTFAQKFNSALNNTTSYGEDNFSIISQQNTLIDSVISNNCERPILEYDETITIPESPIFNGGNCDNSSFYLIEEDWNHDSITTENFHGKKVILFSNLNRPDPTAPSNYYSDNNGRLTITNDLILDPNAWLIVHGNLYIESHDVPFKIDGNILVTGNIIIQGDDEVSGTNENDEVEFNSTVYAIGTGKISNTKIKGLIVNEGTVNEDVKQLVLLTKGNLDIYRINEFSEIPTNSIDSALEGYFYTDADADLYGVGSLFIIKGGLFAQHSLTINAVRGDVQRLPDDTLNFDNTPDESRFYIIYDDQVITDQLDSLPIVTDLHVILDEYYIK